MRAPQNLEQVARRDGGFGVFEAAGVGGVVVVEAQGGAGLQPDDRVIAREFVAGRGPQVAPVIVGSFGPVSCAVDRAAIEQEDFVGVLRRQGAFLLALQAADVGVDGGAGGGG